MPVHQCYITNSIERLYYDFYCKNGRRPSTLIISHDGYRQLLNEIDYDYMNNDNSEFLGMNIRIRNFTNHKLYYEVE